MINQIDNGKFYYPWDVVMNPKNGRIIICDCGNNRVQVFDESGKFLMKFGSRGDKDGEFNKPCSVAIDQRSGRIIVADSGNNRIQIFDENGNFIMKFGSQGSNDDQFD